MVLGFSEVHTGNLTGLNNSDSVCERESESKRRKTTPGSRLCACFVWTGGKRRKERGMETEQQMLSSPSSPRPPAARPKAVLWRL